ncbi:hypothetical protein [Streptomyces aidingensis]|uniref:Uncharacterized protein n=1 Tax=Streptomyces aidingensis TaxID=910347 RepID=A0A1I1N680_9ACTN|nr:hypothetical protein [Streptomyces aidingensis]SFC93181.1 hypothetical protein SAMN05421773_107249 [Streptomyces aidingensis]
MITRTSPLWLPPPELLPASRTALRDGARSPLAPPDPAGPLPDPRDADYDAYFGVARTRRAPAAALARALLTTTAEVSAWAGPADRRALGGALTVCRLLPSPPPARPASPPSSAGTAGMAGTAGEQALARWKAGHRLFLALTQAVVVALRDATAPGAPHHPGRPAGHDAAVLLRACAAAMRATASFTPHAYETAVRPSMTPPRREREGFSGLWSADHRTLVAELRRWGSAHSAACAAGCEAVRDLADALAEVHAAHHGVCARFVGAGPSLLGGGDSALHTLDRLAAARGGLLTPLGKETRR